MENLKIVSIDNKKMIKEAFSFYEISPNARVNTVITASTDSKPIGLVGVGKLPKGKEGEFEIIRCWFDYSLADSALVDKLIEKLDAQKIVTFMPLQDFDFKRLAKQFKPTSISRYQGKTYRRYEWCKDGR